MSKHDALDSSGLIVRITNPCLTQIVACEALLSITNWNAFDALEKVSFLSDVIE